LDTAKFHIDVINVDDIIFTSEGHKKLVKNKIDKYYTDRFYNGIRGIFKSIGNGKYKIIDGYHRVNETEKKEILSIIY
jgi:hypothetical protein